MPDRPEPGPLDDLLERLFGNIESTLGVSVPRPPSSGEAQSARTPRLDRFARDLTAAAARGELDPVVAREAEIDEVLEVLARRTKNNPVLVGDPGVGKTAIVEGIAQRVHAGSVPAALQGVRVVALDLAGMVAGTRYRGDFEERLTRVIDEVVAAHRSIVLFVDELHAVVGAGAAEGGALDAATILKPALARGSLQLIGATTAGDYRRNIEKDPALERRFAPVHIAEPTVEVTVEILRGLRPRYEEHHGVRLSDAALLAAAQLSHRYITDRFLPDKAVDLIDRAGARARIRAAGASAADEDRLAQLRRARDVAIDAEDHERVLLLVDEIRAIETPFSVPGDVVEVGADDVAAVVAQATGIPVARLSDSERGRLLALEDLLRRRVVGQDDAVEVVADAVRAGRAGLAHPGRPVGSFLFIGPTGVGKTELARALAEALFGSSDALLRFDMSEYSERASAFRLVGAPPGHVGYDDPGQLTEVVRRTPYSVVLLDEIEKAHADVVATLLQVLDAGRLTDSHGRTVDFTNTVVVMTSNLGAPFRPEFRGRIDEVVTFRPLGPPELRAIIRMMLTQTAERLAAQGIELDVTDAAVDWLALRGHDAALGARPLRRTIGRELERRLSRMIIEGELARGQAVRADVVDDALDVRVSSAPNATGHINSTKPAGPP